MQIVFFKSMTSVRPFHSSVALFQELDGTRGAQIRIGKIPWSKIVLGLVLVFLLTGGFQEDVADGATTGRIRVSARVLSVGTMERMTSQLEGEWADAVQEAKLRHELASLGDPERFLLQTNRLQELMRHWNGERDVENGLVRLEFTPPTRNGGNALLQIEWIGN